MGECRIMGMVFRERAKPPPGGGWAEMSNDVLCYDGMGRGRSTC